VNADRIREVLNRRPFEPFEVIMSSGERHLVKHPEFLMLLPSTVVIGDPVTDRLAIRSLVHVTELRPAQPQASG
jgi:hypothetical protein